MPLLVQCPRGCQVKMPRSRAGKVVRCPECKCAMRVTKLTVAQLKMGRVIPCRAKLARRRMLDPEEAAQRKKESQGREAEVQKLKAESEVRESRSAERLASESARKLQESRQSKTAAQLQEKLEPASSPQASLVPAVEQPKEKKSKDLESANNGTQPDSQIPARSSESSDLGADPWIEPSSETATQDASPAEATTSSTDDDSKAEVDMVAEARLPTPPPTDLLDLPDPNIPKPPKPKRRYLVGPPVATAAKNSNRSFATIINLEDPTEPAEEKGWEERLSVANQDRRLFARFFAICLSLVAVLNVIPAGLQWYHWTQLTDSAPLPRWIYIQLFIAATYLIYAIFLAQIPDWSALRAASVAMLLMAFVFGIISTGLLIGGHGDFSGYLGIPFALNRQACIWCVAMLCVATLMSFWGGKESVHWQRAEQILQNIVSKG